MEKITLEEFRRIRSFFFSYDGPYDYSYGNKYRKYLSELLSYDLSEIPFEEWKGMRLSLFHNNLSSSCPNLDFAILHPESSFVFVNFKGCHLRNLDSEENVCVFENIYLDQFNEMQIEKFEVLKKPPTMEERLFNSALNGKLEIQDYRKYKNSITKNQLRFWTRKNEGIQNLKKLFASYENYFSLVDPSLDKLAIFNGKVNLLHNHPIQTEEDLKKYLVHNIKYENGKNISLKAIKILSKYISLDDLVSEGVFEEEEMHFIKKCGLDNLIHLNNQYDEFLDKQYMNKFILTIFSIVSNDLYKKNFDIRNTICNQDRITQYESFINKEFLEDSIEVYEYFKLIITLSKFVDKGEMFDIRNLSKIFPEQFVTEEEIKSLLSAKEYASFSGIRFEREFREKKYFRIFFQYAEKYPKFLPFLKEKDLPIPINYKVYYDHLCKDDFYQFMTSYSNFITETLELGEEKIADFFEKNGNDAEASMDAILLCCIKKRRVLSYKSVQDLPAIFKKRHPELFLKDKFAAYTFEHNYYSQNIGASNIYRGNKEYFITLLKDIDMSVMLLNSEADCTMNNEDKNIYEVLGTRFSNEEIINLMYMYGKLFDQMAKMKIFSTSFTKEEMMNVFYEKSEYILSNHSFDIWVFPLDKEFQKRYPEFYLEEDAPDILKDDFLNRRIDIGCFRRYKDYHFSKYLKDKTTACFYSSTDRLLVNQLLSLKISQEEVYQLFEVYGHVIEKGKVKKDFSYAIERIITRNENVLNPIRHIEEILCHFMYSLIEKKELVIKPDDDEFHLFKELYPNVFLSDKANATFKKRCYGLYLRFGDCSSFKDQIQYLKGKDIKLFLSYQEREFASKYSEEQVLSLLSYKPEMISEMIENRREDTMVEWYDKHHFLPHPVVLLNLDASASDRFLAGGRKWSKLMYSTKNWNSSYEFVDALFKASCVFGVFDGDDKGYNTVSDLFVLPRNFDVLKKEKIIGLLETGDSFSDFSGLIDPFKELYKNGNLDYNYYKSIPDNILYVLHTQLANWNFIMSQQELHQIFGGMDTKYNPAFREFFLENLEYAKEEGHLSEFSKIERNFNKIVAFNKGRKMTFDTALDYISTVEYGDIEVGNEYLATLSSKSGYDEDDFDELQQIYHFTKLRTVNSIPRVFGQIDNYSYEILRLDDPLALVIGELTDCCQELNDAAKSSMIHSATNENGRVFVVRAKDNSIVAQSWVWRRDDTICFDNIEIPERLLKKENKEVFTKEVLAVYQQVAHDLMEKENEVYQQLLKEGKISQNEFDSLKLSKVTVGMGYNDIKETILQNLDKDIYPSKPYDYRSVIDNSSYLYLDSENQYILEENVNKKGRQKENFSYPVFAYQDEFCIYTKENMDQYKKELLENMLEDSVDVYYYDDIFEAIGDTYKIENDKLKIVMNYNFVFILKEVEDRVIIEDVCLAKEKLNSDEEAAIFEQMSYAYDTLKLTYKTIESKVEEEKTKDFIDNLGKDRKKK